MSNHVRHETHIVEVIARVLLDRTPPDPDAAQHLATLSAAMGAGCLATGCDKPMRAMRFCDAHYRQFRRMFSTNEAHNINRKAAA